MNPFLHLWQALLLGGFSCPAAEFSVSGNGGHISPIFIAYSNCLLIFTWIICFKASYDKTDCCFFADSLGCNADLPFLQENQTGKRRPHAQLFPSYIWPVCDIRGRLHILQWYYMLAIQGQVVGEVCSYRHIYRPEEFYVQALLHTGCFHPSLRRCALEGIGRYHSESYCKRAKLDAERSKVQ